MKKHVDGIAQEIMTQFLKSQNGWTASKDAAEIEIISVPIKGTKIKVRCAKAVAPLIAGFCAEFHELIEPIDEGSLDDWGYCFRMVRGSTDNLSNHSSGTAVDLNATRHRLGRKGTFPNEKVPMIRALAKKYGMLWGGDFRRYDEMHFEIAVTPAKAAALIGSLGIGE
jgi:hypothetical protein